MTAATAGPAVAARRTLTVPVVALTGETRSAGGELKLSGIAAPYGKRSHDIGFFEVIERGAFAASLAGDADVILLWQHDHTRPLARTRAGSLQVADTPEGVRFTATLPPTSLAADAVELVRSGVVDEMSFGFTVEQDSWETRDGQRVRVVKRAKLHEVSLVTQAAYGAATSVQARNRQLAERIERTVAGMRRPSVTPDPYSPTGEHSYFRDRAAVDASERAHTRLVEAGFGPAWPGQVDTTAPTLLHGGVREARERLAQLGRHLRETRDLSTTPTAGGYFVAGGAPVHVAEAFAAAARSRATLPNLLPVHPLPETGMTLKTPRITTGVSTEPQAAENTAPTEVDIVETAIESPVSTITGIEDVSQQLLDRAEPGIDTVIATELGRAIGADLDTLLLTGSGTAPYLRGLDNVSGITSVAYTDASPTFAELVPKLAECASRVATALGSDPTHLLWHPRREAWAVSSLGTTFSLLANALPYNIRPVTVPAITTTAGAGTNEDKIYVVRADELPLWVGPVSFQVLTDWAGSGTLTVRCRAIQYVSALFARRPEAIGVVSGTGLSAWY